MDELGWMILWAKFELQLRNPYADLGFKLFGLKLKTNVWMPRGNLAVQSRL